MPKKNEKTPILLRIAGKFTINVNGCWIWHASMSSQGRYPTLSGEGDSRKPVYVHRLMWEALNGPMAEGKAPDGSRWELHHCCPAGYDNRCINPEHIAQMSAKQHRAIHKKLRKLASFLNLAA